ncbi:energy-coupling factor transporter ATPase [Terrilactibacillus laevilacticus]|uniref:Energy-coupling factor transporter ATP-binding protein EcfA2 n=1 Tax=Terrilactibacillus laevilacticus TaxID=1380157 RepID=A0ABW5PRG8_9BACI|nr:energy-coupling factor transporter ATPase [Terrilactibacillus laevilacticus]
MKPILEIRDLEHVYMKNTPLEHRALSNVNMTINKGECIAIIGHTGSGKSTLIQHFNGLMTPQKGTVIVDGEDVLNSKIDIKALRRKVGLVFQNPESQLFERLIGDDIAYGPLKMGLPIKEVRDRVEWAMEMVGLPFDEMKDRPTYALSGGQKRKVALAGVLALQPEILVLDEPTAGLDPRSKIELLDRIKKLNRKENITIIFISHNLEEVTYMADRLYVMANGTNIIDGTPSEIFSNKNILKENNIGTPETVEILYLLQDAGFSIDSRQYEVDGVANQISSILQYFQEVRANGISV